MTASGNGSTGVELNNSSQMAFAKHIGTGSHSLSHDFSYESTEPLSFIMQATATAHPIGTTTVLQARSGVTVSLLNTFNIRLGSVSLIYATDPSSIGSNNFSIDAAQHEYSGLMGEWASLAGLDATDPISKISLSFFSWAESKTIFPLPVHSSSAVWFDNVSTVVPIPAAAWLFGSALLGLVGVARRKKAA